MTNSTQENGALNNTGVIKQVPKPFDSVTILLTVLLLLSFVAFVIFVSYISKNIYTNNKKYQASYSLEHQKQSVDPANGKATLTEIDHDSSNVPNARELFPLVAAFAVFLGFLATVTQLRLSQMQAQKQYEHGQLQLEAVRKQIGITETQNQRADEWRTTEYITTQLASFNKDRSVINFMRMLESIDAEYNARITVDLVEPGRPDSEKNGPTQRVEISVGKQTLMNGFTPDPGPFFDVVTGKKIEFKVKHTPIENKIAHESDEFFTYLNNFRKYISDGMFTKEDLYHHLDYWLKLIVAPQDTASVNAATCEQAGRIRDMLHAFLKAYYNGSKGSRNRGACYFIIDVLQVESKDHAYETSPFYEGEGM